MKQPTLLLLAAAISLHATATPLNKSAKEDSVSGHTADTTQAAAIPPAEHMLPRFIYTNIAIGNRHGADYGKTANIELGLLNYTDVMNGFSLELMNSSIGKSMNGVNIAGILNGNIGNSNGLSLAGVSNMTAHTMNGMQIAGTVNFAGKANGVQMAVLTNITMSPMNGVQLSLTNVARGIKSGVQAGMINISSSAMHGVQAGEYNYADTLRGLQAGALNVSGTGRNGFQLGLVNISGDDGARSLGLINISPSTDVKLLVYGGNYDKLTVAAQFRNRHTYSILGIGSYHTGLGTERYSGSVVYRTGLWYQLVPKLSVSTDIGYSHIETFREKSSESPERLFALQWRANLNWQISKYIGMFVTGGYGQTRWYSHNRKFRDKPIIEAGLTADFKPSENNGFTARPSTADRMFMTRFERYQPAERDSMFAYNLPRFQKKHPWWALAEDVGINIFVQSWDRFVERFDYSNINPSTLAANFRHGFVWDNDFFSTNQFAHPYHGNLYFNSARTNGLTFWESCPYVLGGSLMWEFWGETDPPAINDVFSTTCGGIAIGEVFYRTSSLLLDDSKRGWPRFWRELGAGIIDPVRAFNRIIHGDAWRVRRDHNLYHDDERLPVDATLLAGTRFVADEGYMTRGSRSLRIGFRMEYGDAFADEPTTPYDYFSAELGFNFGGQPFVSDIHLIGRLYGSNLYEGRTFRAQWGVFQHFDYYASDSIKGSKMKNPYEISETAAFGPGLVLQTPGTGSLQLLEQRLFINGILLGGSKSDYYRFLDRDYNIGSGFGWKSETRLVFRKFGMFRLKAEYYHLYTWKGFERKDYEDPDFDAHFLNAQGDKSNAQLFVVSPVMDIHIHRHWGLTLQASYYNRVTRYTWHSNRHSSTFDFTAAITYKL